VVAKIFKRGNIVNIKFSRKSAIIFLTKKGRINEDTYFLIDQFVSCDLLLEKK